MSIGISDGEMTCNATGHTVSWLPGRALTRNQAITAMVLGEAAGRDPGPGDRIWPHVEGWAAELGLRGDTAVSMARGREPGAGAGQLETGNGSGLAMGPLRNTTGGTQMGRIRDAAAHARQRLDRVLTSQPPPGWHEDAQQELAAQPGEPIDWAAEDYIRGEYGEEYEMDAEEYEEFMYERACEVAGQKAAEARQAESSGLTAEERGTARQLARRTGQPVIVMDVRAEPEAGA